MNGHRLGQTLYFLLCGLCLRAGSANANTYYVSKVGNDARSCAQATSESGAKLTLNNAVSCSSARDCTPSR
jgi:hypothetical protein